MKRPILLLCALLSLARVSYAPPTTEAVTINYASGNVLNSQNVNFAAGKLRMNGTAVGTVTSVAATGNNGITISGSPVTTSGTITFGLGAVTPTSVTTSSFGAFNTLSVTGDNDLLLASQADPTKFVRLEADLWSGTLTASRTLGLYLDTDANASLRLRGAHLSPSASGTLVGSGDTGTVTNTMLAGSIALSKLAITGTPDGTKFLRDDFSWQAVAGTGDVTAAAAFANDNRLIRSDGTGKGVQASGITIDDSNSVSGIDTLSATALSATNIGVLSLNVSAGGTLFFAGGAADRFVTVADTQTIADRMTGFIFPDADANYTFPSATSTLATLGANTFTGAQINSAAGAASAPALKLSGVPFAGTGTTSFPLLYVNDASATASTTLTTAGTYLGVNGDGTQDLLNLLKDGTSQLKVASDGTVTAAGAVRFTQGASSTNTTNGTIVVTGGGAFTGAVNIGGNFNTAGAIISAPQTLSGAGAVNVTTLTTKLTSSGDDQALTLADGTNGQIKFVIYAAEGAGGDEMILTPTTKTGFSSITLSAAGNALQLVFLTTQGWMLLSNYGATVTP